MEVEVLHAAANQTGNAVSAVTGPWQFAALALMLGFIVLLFCLYRDRRISAMEKNIAGLGNSFDKHVNESHPSFESSINTRLEKIEANLILRSEFVELVNTIRNIDKGVAVIGERHRYEDMLMSKKGGGKSQ